MNEICLTGNTQGPDNATTPLTTFTLGLKGVWVDRGDISLGGKNTTQAKQLQVKFHPTIKPLVKTDVSRIVLGQANYEANTLVLNA